MENSNISVGLDIGTTKIVALVGKKNEFNKVEILLYLTIWLSIDKRIRPACKQS